MFIKSTIALAVALCAGHVAAQAGANSTIDPNTVTLTLRSQWCSAQLNTCGTLCSGDVEDNKCDENTLEFECTCASNHSTPGLEFYTGTMPTFICEQLFQNCILSNVGVAAAQAKCNSDEKKNCGQKDPTDFVSVATTSTAAPTTTRKSSPTPTGDGDDTDASDPETTPSSPSPSSTPNAAGPTMMPFGREYGSGILAAGFAAALIL